jgi:hypothetical protein
MVVSFLFIFRTLLLTSHCVGSFQRPTVPRAGWLLYAASRRSEDLLWTNNICLFYMLSVRDLLFCETTYLLEHRPSPECHITHSFVLKKLFFPVSLTIPYRRIGQLTKIFATSIRAFCDVFPDVIPWVLEQDFRFCKWRFFVSRPQEWTQTMQPLEFVSCAIL